MFTHFVKFSETPMAWSSCRCLSERNHFVGEEVYPPRPTPLGVKMHDMEKKRNVLRNMYGPGWKAKVDKMPDTQVVAIYRKFQAEGKIR